MTDITIDITIKDERWNIAIGDIETIINKAINFCHCEKARATKQSTEISIVLANDPFIQDLNKTYRDKDTPTNVLSFPASEPDEQTPFSTLGDIILSYDTIACEAQEQSKSFPDHFAHMLVHGCLHLLHFDHDNDKAAEEMEKLEITLLAHLGIKNPYESE